MKPEADRHITIGPPGTGKTTLLSDQAEQAHEAGENVTIISLTKSSAAEVAGRNLAIPDGQIGTLHSQCYHALRGAEIAETAKHCEDWNDRFPHYAVTPITRRNEDPIEEEGGTAPGPPGNKLLSEVKILRGKMIPPERWPGHLRRFGNQWKRWKEEQKLLDFTDLVETALREIPEAPGKPTVIMIDEAQDMDRLEMALAAKWGAGAGRLVAAGDPDQCQPPGSMILTSRGSIPIERIDEDHDRLVTWKQSQNALIVQGGGYPLKIRYSQCLLAIG